MGRIYFNNKDRVEESTELCIFRLNGWGVLKGKCWTALKWTREFLLGEKIEQSAGLLIDLTCQKPYAKINYTITRKKDGSTEYYDYKIYLDKTPCNLGGFRYWFLCPNCGRRAGKLYRKILGEMYICRICNNLTYESRNEPRIDRPGGIGYFLKAGRQIEKIYKTVKHETWRGKPTRKMRRIAQLERKGREITHYPRFRS